MKIAFVSPDAISVSLFAKGIINTLKKIPGAEITIVCNMTQYGDQLKALNVNCYHIESYRFFNVRKDILYLFQLWRLMKSEKFDVVFTFCTKQNIYGSIAAKLAFVNVVFCHVVGLGSAFASRLDLKGKLLRRVTLFLYRLACMASKKIWFTNKNDKAAFIELGLIAENKAVLTPNYLDVNEYSIQCISETEKAIARNICKTSANEIIVIMVARMIWAKGIKEFCEAAVSLKDSYPTLKFVLVAPEETGSYGAVPPEYVKSKEQEANFIWLGFQEHVKRLYAVADLAVLPTYYKEGGYPRALLEPMAMGKPVIATDSEDCRGAVEDGLNGFLIPIKNSSALADAIVKIMDNPELRTKLGAYSLVKVARDFDESNIVPLALRQMGLPV